MKHFLIIFAFSLLVAVESAPVTKNPLELDNFITWKITFNPKKELIGHSPSSPKPSELFHITKSPLEFKKSGPQRTFAPGAFTYKPPYNVGPPKRTFAPLEELSQNGGPGQLTLFPLHDHTRPHLDAQKVKVTIPPPLEEKYVPSKDHSKPPPCHFSRVGCPHVRPTPPPSAGI